eukprot:76798_1
MAEDTHFIDGERVAMLILTIIPTITMVPLNIFILYIYTKYHKQMTDGLPKFKTTFTFIILTILFFILYCLRGINFCYGDFKYDGLYIMSATPFYGGHFLFFCILLFDRLRTIFNNTQYELSKCTKNTFWGLVIFGISDAVLFVIVRFIPIISQWGNIFYFIGTATIILTYLWISFLYIIKLFKVVRDSTRSACNETSMRSEMSFTPSPIARSTSVSSASPRAGEIKANKQILSSMTKYTILTTISIVTNMSFWCIPFLERGSYFMHWFTYLLLWQLSISVNIIGFGLGFHFSHSLYTKLCVHADRICELCFENMVYCVIIGKVNSNKEQANVDEKNIEIQIQKEENKEHVSVN